MLQRLIEWAKADFPDIRIILLGIFDAKCFTAEMQSLAGEYNTLCQLLTAKYEGVSYLDINPFFYDCKADLGNLEKLRDIFLEDDLHLTDEGYAQFAPYFAEKMKNLLFE